MAVYNTTTAGRTKGGYQQFVIGAGPTALLMASLFVKFVYASLSLGPVPLESSVVSAMVASVLLLAMPLPWIGRMGRFVSAILVNFALTLLLTADRVHLGFFGDPISVAQLSDAWQIPSVASSILAKLQLTEFLYYADILVALVALPSYVRLSRQMPKFGSRWRVACSCGLLAFGLVASIPTMLIFYRDSDNVFAWRPARRDFVAVMGFLPYHLYDVIAYLDTVWGRMNLTDSQRQRVRLFVNERRQALSHPSPLFGVARGRNVIIIQCESLQAFPVGLRIDGQSVTPNLDAFSNESLRFVNFYDQTHEGATSDGVLLSLQSLHPVEAGAMTTRYPANHYRGLPALLSDKGYTILAAMGASGEYWNIRGTLISLGVHRLYLADFYQTGERFGQGLADGDFFRQTIPMLLNQREPFMAFLITVSNHDPYDLPEKHRSLNLGTLQGTRIGKYLDSVHYFDRAFGELVVQLRKTGLLDKSVVVVYGDHQGWLRNPPELARLLGISEQSGYEYWKVRKKLPLLIRLPHGAHAGVKTATGGHLDISPTLLGLLGVVSDNAVMLGTDLTHGDDSLVVFRDGSFADGKNYFINAPELARTPFVMKLGQIGKSAASRSSRGAGKLLNGYRSLTLSFRGI